jgi:hypothetical protein
MPKLNTVGVCLALLTTALLLPAALTASVTLYEDAEKGIEVEVAGNIQIQYFVDDPEGGESSDRLFFRRLRPTLEGSFGDGWSVKLDLELGNASGDNEVALRDAFIGYDGFDNVSLRFGNAKPPFSREFLTSSKRQQLVERTFVGDHNYGSPDRVLGIHLDGELVTDTLTWGAAFGSAAMDPSSSRLDFDTPVNRSDDWQEGWLAGARLDYFPFEKFRFSQADFDRGALKLGLGVAAFTWSDDGDVNTYSSGGDLEGRQPDIDSSTGFELSAAVRVRGLSVDVQHNRIDADTVLAGFSRGLYRNGETTLEVSAVEAGYLLPFDADVEVIGGYESLDADGYLEAWTRLSAGLNWYLDQHNLKLSTTLRRNMDANGAPGADDDELFVQLQYAF